MTRNNHYAQEAKSKPIPTCPSCGKQAGEANTKYGIRNQCCGLWSWDRHPLADKATHEARKAAHAAFDKLWRSGEMKRGDAYKALAEEMGMSRSECHIKLMDEANALRVIEAVEAIQ